MIRKAIILNRRFWWLYPDGRRELVLATERLIQQVRQSSSQLRAAQRAVEEAEAPPRRTNHPPRSPGTKPMLPAASRNIGDMTLTELAHEYGWGSVYRFTEALRKKQHNIYRQARANGKKRALSNLMTPTYGEQE